MLTADRRDDLTPSRPGRPVPAPPHQIRFTVEVETAHLANPRMALQRLLAGEASAFARVDGDDDDRFEVVVAVADDNPQTHRLTAAWVRWCAHNAGIRGAIDIAPSPGGPR